jgi:rubrerythrin
MIQASCEETIELLFENAIEIEKKAAHIYERLSKLFSHVPGLYDFWGALVEDEKRHATTLQDVQKLLTPEQLLAHPDKKIWDDMASIQRLLSKDLIGAINTLDDAYELAHELEFSEVNAIFQFLAAEFVPSAERKKQVISEITQHQQKLLDFSRNFGDRNWRKGINIQRI